MKKTVHIKELRSSLISFLLIPSSFISIVYLGKLLDSLNVNSYKFSIESVLGFFTAFIVTLISYNKQNQSSFIIQQLKTNKEYTFYITISNLSHKTSKIKISVFSDSGREKFQLDIEKYSNKDLSALIRNKLPQEKAQNFNIKINASTKRNDLIIKAGNYHKPTGKITDESPP